MQKITELYYRLPRLIRNRYAAVLLVFLVWIFLFDTNNLLVQFERKKELNDLKSDIQFLKETIEEDKETVTLLDDPQELEEYARVKYKMKRPDEDIYIITRN